MAVELRGLEGKVALVTGAGRGQGSYHARALAEAGCDVAALDICAPIAGLYETATQDDLDMTVKEVQAAGRRGLGLTADVRDSEAVRVAVEAALAEFGQIDILINNAGTTSMNSLHEMPVESANAVLDTNLKGAMWTGKYVVPQMIERRSGHIINIVSAVVGSGTAMFSPYVASKHGLVGLTKAWATELSEFGINVNAVGPGTIKPGPGRESHMVSHLAGLLGLDVDAAFEGFSVQCNLPGDKWRIECQHITDAVLFLASENARMITGQVLMVDGGHTTK